MRPLLIIGASGQIGGAILATALKSGLDVFGTYHRHAVPGLEQLSLTEENQIHAFFSRVQPGIVCIPASFTNVDGCESDPNAAFDVNVKGVQYVVRQANRIGAKVVYFSSDYIFDGTAGPYVEDDPPRPLCEYGRQKVYAEHVVACQAQQWLIIRTTVVYGWERQGKNFICRLLKTLSAGQELKVPNDQIGNPTYAPDLAQSVLSLITKGSSGIFHVVGEDRVSRYVFAMAAANAFGLPPDLITPISTAQLNQVARRPLDGGMRTGKLMVETGRALAGYKDALERMAADQVAGVRDAALEPNPAVTQGTRVV